MSTITDYSERQSSGTVLIVAMWVVLVLAGLALVFARAMRVEVGAAANQVAGLQADAVAQAAVQFVLSQVDNTPPQRPGHYTPDPSVSFEGVQVGDGYFWILNPRLDDDRACYFGIRDEASRINLNSATTDMLLKLPGMTAEMAAAISDWRDGDSDVSPGGAESEYYLLLPDPYYCKNAPFETVDEILSVRGASPQFLFGEDTNHNGVLDANENDAADTDPPDNRDGHLDRGILDCVTVYSQEPNQGPSAAARINVNDSNLQPLSALLRTAVSQDQYFRVMDLVRRGRPFRNVLDFYVKTGLTAAEFAQIADQITTSREENLVGLVNVDTAPRAVLLCLPGLEESDVDALLAKRQSPDTDLTNVAWVGDALTREKAVAAGDLITTRSYQFSVDIVAVSVNGRAFRRYRAIVDATTTPPRVIYWKDLTHLGWPLAPAILASLRAGESVVASVGPSVAGGQ